MLSIFDSQEILPICIATRLQRHFSVFAYEFDVKWIDTKSFAYGSRFIPMHDKLSDHATIAATSAGSMVNVKNKNAPSHSSDMVNAKQKLKSAPGANGGKATVKNKNVPRNSNVFNTTAIRCVDEEDVAIKMIQHNSDSIKRLAMVKTRTLLVTFDATKEKARTGFFARREHLMFMRDVISFDDRNFAPKKTRIKIPTKFRKSEAERMKMFTSSKVFRRGVDVIKNVFNTWLESFKITFTTRFNIKKSPHHSQLRKCFFRNLNSQSHALDDSLRFHIMTTRIMETCIDLLKPGKERSIELNKMKEQQFKTHHRAKWKHFGISHRVASQKLFSNNRKQIKKRWYIIDNNLHHRQQLAARRLQFRLRTHIKVEPESVAQQNK
jgi:hypothetical protein